MPNTEPGSPSFGYWLRRRRKAHDLTQRALAAAVSCSEDAIRKIEADERRPSRRLAERLAARLKVSGPDLEVFLAAARATGSIDRLSASGSQPGSMPGAGEAFRESHAPDQPSAGMPDKLRRAHPDSGAVFVGRQRELAELRAAFDQMQSAGGRVAMLAGEPGIGKTRTSGQIAAYATMRGAVVLWGRCQEGGGAPAYWPWTQALRAYVRDAPTDRLEREVGADACIIAEIVPELRVRMGGLSDAASLDPEAARFRLFDAIASFFRAVATPAPVLIVLDDLHWADPASLKLLAFVAGELGSARMLIVGTYRDAEVHRRHPLSVTLAELQRSGVLQRTTLRGLARDDVADFVVRWFGSDAPPAGLIDAIHQQTEGNPLFVSEAVRLLAEEGGLDGGLGSGQYNWTMRIPDGVREVIGRRLDRLSDACNALLAIAAVIGRQFTLGQLEAAQDDMPAEERLTLLDEATAARVVEPLAGAAGQYQFTHALMGEVLVDELPAARRARLHWTVGEGLERMYAGQAPEHASTLVHHFVQGAVVGGTGKLVQYSVHAGERALATHAYEEAVGHFERALAARAGGLADDAQSAAILFGLGRAQLATLERHRYVDAARSLRAAFDRYVALGDVASAVTVAEQSFPHFPGVETEMAAVIRRALDLVPPHSPECGRLLSRHGRILGITDGDYAGASEAFQRSLVIARDAGDLATEARTLGAALCVDFFHLQHAASLEKGPRALAISRELGDLDAEAAAAYWYGSSVRSVGDTDLFETTGRTMLATAEKLRNRFWLAGAIWFEENAARFRGDWDKARQASERGLALSPLDIRLLGTRALLEFECGEEVAGNGYVERLLDLTAGVTHGTRPEHAMTAAMVLIGATFSGAIDRRFTAEREALAVLQAPSRAPALRLVAAIGLAMLAVARGDADAAGLHLSLLLAHRGTSALPGGHSCDRIAGTIAGVLGDHAGAVGHSADAIAFCRRSRNRPELAWSLHDHARALFMRDGRGDREAASTSAAEALALAHEIGMKVLSQRIASLPLATAATPPAAPAPATPRDRASSPRKRV